MLEVASEGSRAAVLQKIQRIAAGGKPRTLDLFAGCGGLTLGFHAAGFETVGAVESDPIAANSHAKNFFGNLQPRLVTAHADAQDITRVEPEQLLQRLEINEPQGLAIDVIIGGPPCQAFARVGRAKLREIADHPEAFLKDPRGNLYLRYLHYVAKLRPVAILMENVPDVLNYGGHNIAEEMCEALSVMGYACGYTLLNSVYYGVPQMRERMFLVALARELGTAVEFPSPTHWIQLPRGYHGSRQVALQTVKQDLFTGEMFFIEPPQAEHSTCQPAVTAEQALGDLPPITLHLEGKLKRGARRLDVPVPFPRPPRLNSYARLIREWPGFEGPSELFDHVIRCLPRDYAIFARMNPGDEYPGAYAHALALFEERLKKLSRRMRKKLLPTSRAYKRLYKETVPPYDPGKFPNKWRKMERDLPARTLMAHLGKDGYSHSH